MTLQQATQAATEYADSMVKVGSEQYGYWWGMAFSAKLELLCVRHGIRKPKARR